MIENIKRIYVDAKEKGKWRNRLAAPLSTIENDKTLMQYIIGLNEKVVSKPTQFRVRIDVITIDRDEYGNINEVLKTIRSK